MKKIYLDLYRTALFEDLSTEDKSQLRTELLKEQGYLCAYCMARIKDEAQTTKIEHYQPRNKTNQVQYSNLLIVCRGNEGSPAHATTCDTKKGNTSLYLNPQNRIHIQSISYDSLGTIKSSDEKIDKDLNECLNLNNKYGYLVTNRKAALDSFKRKIY